VTAARRKDILLQSAEKYKHRADAEAMSGPHFKLKVYPELKKKFALCCPLGWQEQNMVSATSSAS